ncbi:MAG: hypothetical protein CMD39_03010 [Gammaproteobacteria bacterium]|nr:hypothetical protein [Gammaproteobacteria bacterium]
MVLGVMALFGACAGHAEDQLERSRAIAVDFQQQLGSGLMAAMEQGGPVAGIGVCADIAPAIAARASAQAGARVARTALRVRNPANAPDSDAARVLEEFSRQVAAGEAMPVEHIGPGPNGGTRYMRAIVLQPLCATCHGATLAPPVAEAVAARYPDDRAVGFEVGELRGAFLIDWPAEEATP